jgi:hypothetical protein
LLGLRPRTGVAARLGREEALDFQALAQLLRQQLEASIPGTARGAVDLRPDPEALRQRLLGKAGELPWLRHEAVSPLRQLFMHEHRHVRLLLVEALARIRGPEASTALCGVALFDLHPEVRSAALAALASRPRAEYEQSFVWGLRYPWPAAADHAAEALVALDLRATVPQLIAMLDARDLGEPFPVDAGPKRWTMVPELVRLNHLRNCLLCHAPSFAAADPIRGPVPNTAQLLPLPASGPRTGAGDGRGWSGRGGGGGGGGKVAQTLMFTYVRADITFLKQDFSVIQPVPNHGRFWPADQRQDYLVRLRPVSKQELLLWQERRKEPRPPAPQQESLLFALRELTGEDLGPAPEDWRRLYSPVTGQRLQKPLEGEERVLHLRDSLIEAPPSRQAELLLQLKESSGPAYDHALALALPRLPGELQEVARTLLSDRMHCLTREELRAKLGDKSPDVRRAAVRACLLRVEKALVPDLIALLDDEGPLVAKKAQQALREMTLRNFGPPPAADREKRRQAIAAWQDWWDQQGRKWAEPKRGS